MDILKTYKYKDHTIDLYFSGFYSCFTYEYGIIKSDTLSGIIRMLNEIKKETK